jgi:hypothetical protein
MNTGEKKYLGFPEQGFVIESFGADSNNLPIKEMNNSTELSPLLQQVIIDSEKDLNTYYYPNGPVLGLGIDIYGTVVVQINKDWNVNQSTIKDIYQIIEKNGEKNGIKNIPCKFLSMGLMKTEAG